MIHLITYDLKSPNDTSDDYERVINGLKETYKTWCHLEKSVWLISTDQGATEVRDEIKKLLNSSDILFVAKLAGNWGSFNLTTKRTDWLKARDF
jgi:hypothetical protein